MARETDPRLQKTLVIGGIKDFIDKSIAPRLARYGLAVEWHWSMERPLSKSDVRIPPDCQVVIAMVDMFTHGHTMGPHIREAAEKAGVVYIATQRKMSIFDRDLRLRGFEPVGPFVALATIETEVEEFGYAMTTIKPRDAVVEVPLDQRLKHGDVEAAKLDLRAVMKRLKALGCKSVLWTPEGGLEIVMPVVIVQDQTTHLEVE